MTDRLLEGDMLPGSSRTDTPNRVMGDIKLSSYLGVAVSFRKQLTDLAHALLCQFSKAHPLASGYSFGMKATRVLVAALQSLRAGNRAIPITRCLSTLRVAVSVIIGTRPQPKMVGIAAHTVIAGVADKQFIGDRTLGQDVGQAVRSPLLTVQLEGAIATVKDCSCEGPAIVGIARSDFRVEVGRGIMEGHSNHPQTMIGVPPARLFAVARAFSLSKYNRSTASVLGRMAA